MLVASLALYAAYGIRDLLLLGAVIAVSFIGAHAIARSRTALVTVVCVSAVLAPLFVVKYLPWIIEISRVGWLDAAAHSETAVIPPGLSFMTLQAIGYVVDVRRGSVPPTASPKLHALYLSYFPQLVAGPIERAGRLLPQLVTPRAPSPAEYYGSFKLILWGYVAKLVVADQVARGIDLISRHSSGAFAGGILLILFLFSAQLYFDFYAYSCLARGFGAAHGISLSRNFADPYHATTPLDFWRRWHISLSQWLRDYIYVPLGGSWRGASRWIVATLTVFLVSGIWHGAGVGFIVWGLCHGVLVILTRLLASEVRLTSVWYWRSLGAAVTFAAVSILWIPFVTPNTDTQLQFASLLVRGLLAPMQLGAELLDSLAQFWGVAVLATCAVAFGPAVGRQVAATIPRTRLEIARELAFLDCAVLLLLFLGDLGPRSFIYFRF